MSRSPKPTQAQIKAAAKIVCAVLYRPAPDMSGDIWKAVGPGMKQRCVRAAEDILIDLTAAAVECSECERYRFALKRIAHGNESANAQEIADETLTAAAEVESHLSPTLIMQGGGVQYGGHTTREEKRIISATIERCAMVAKQFVEECGLESEALVAAIRALAKP